ncbi:hypothetical protein [Pseudonocardia sp. HH130630-07]|nr:hypothetical protein [Pseudonocardia sp. HH130630-07]
MGIDRLPPPREEVQLAASEEQLLAELTGDAGRDRPDTSGSA